MRSKIKYGLFTLAISTTTFFTGLYYGFDSGAKNFYALESVISANFDVLGVKNLKSGNEEDLNSIEVNFDMYIDEGIDQYNWYQESGNKYLSEMFFSSHVKLLPDSIVRLTKHRKKNPTKNLERAVCNLQAKSEEDKTYCKNHYDKRDQTINLLGS